MSNQDEIILGKVKKFLEFIKKECPECYKKMEKCCDADCCSPQK